MPGHDPHNTAAPPDHPHSRVSDGRGAYARPPRAHPRIAIRSVGACSLASRRSGAAISRKYENTTFRAQNGCATPCVRWRHRSNTLRRPCDCGGQRTRF
ncbi:uncharacterized protein TRAVEDRAFT_32625, partial [Trametes versicolor FP-101664 SS1]